MKIDQIFQNNSDWVSKRLNLDKDYFVNLSKGQNPEVLYIGCSDREMDAEMGVKEVAIFENMPTIQQLEDLFNWNIKELGEIEF